MVGRRIISRLNCLGQTVKIPEKVGLYAGFLTCLTSLADIVKFYGRSLTGCSLLHLSCTHVAVHCMQGSDSDDGNFGPLW